MPGSYVLVREKDKVIRLVRWSFSLASFTRIFSSSEGDLHTRPVDMLSGSPNSLFSTCAARGFMIVQHHLVLQGLGHHDESAIRVIMEEMVMEKIIVI